MLTFSLHLSGFLMLPKVPQFPVHSFRVHFTLSQLTFKLQIPWEGSLRGLGSLWEPRRQIHPTLGEGGARIEVFRTGFSAGRMWEHLLLSSREGCPDWATTSLPPKQQGPHTPGREWKMKTASLAVSKPDCSPSLCSQLFCCQKAGCHMVSPQQESHASSPAWHPLWARMPSHPASWANPPGQLCTVASSPT